MPDIRAPKRLLLEERLGALLRDYADTSRQRDSALEAAARNRLDRQADAIWKDLEVVESELRNMELARSEPAQDSTGPDPAQIHRELRAKLAEIDFEALEQALRSILDTQSNEGCAALLLFQQSARMGGEWCAARIRELLRRETSSGCFRHFPVEFQPGEQIDNMAPLRRLGHHLGLESTGEAPETFARLIAAKLCGSLQMGSVILLELRRCDYLAHAPGVLPWLIDQFWQPLLQELAAVADEYYGVKIIALLFVDAELPPETFPADVCCTLNQFERRHVLEMTLCSWSRDEICNWIKRFSGLPLKRLGVDRMADTVYKATDGIPSLVAQQLLGLCSPVPTR